MKKLKGLDFFGKRSELRFKQKTTFKTWLGSFASWLFFFGGFGILVYFGKDLVIRENPQVISSEKTASLTSYPNTTIFHAAIAFFNQTSRAYVGLDSVLGNSLTIESLLQAFIKIDYDDIEEPAMLLQPVELCSKDKDKTILDNLGSLNFNRPSGVGDLVCLRLSMSDNFELRDRSRKFMGSSLHLHLKADSSSPFLRLINEIQLVFLYQYIILDLNNYESPRTSDVSFYDTKLSSRTEKILNLNLKSLVIESDIGLMIEEKGSEEFLQLDVLQEKVNFLNENVSEEGEPKGRVSLLKIEISLGNKQLVYFRKYVKIQEVLARVGGLLKILWLVTKFIMKPYIKLLYYQRLVNEIFNFYFPSKGNEPLRSSHTMKFLRKIRESSKHMRRLSTSEVRKTLIKKIKGMISKSTGKIKSRGQLEMTMMTKDNNLANININYAESPKNEGVKLENKKCGIQNQDSHGEETLPQKINSTEKCPPLDAQDNKEKEIIHVNSGRQQQDLGNLVNYFNTQNSPNMSSYKSPKNFSEGVIENNQTSFKENEEGCIQKEKKMITESMKMRLSNDGQMQEEYYSPTTKKGMNSLFQVKSSPLNLNALEIGFYHMFNWGTLKKKKKLIKKGIEMIYEKLDIVYILNKLIELDKLKILLFEENQLKLFEYLPKPSLSPTGVTNHSWNSIFHQGEDIFQKARDAAKAFREVKSKPFPSQLDKKILAMIDPNIRDILSEQGGSNSDIQVNNSRQKESLASFSHKRSRSQQDFSRAKEDLDCSIETNMDNNSLKPGSLNLLERNLKSLRKKELDKKFKVIEEKDCD